MRYKKRSSSGVPARDRAQASLRDKPRRLARVHVTRRGSFFVRAFAASQRRPGKSTRRLTKCASLSSPCAARARERRCAKGCLCFAEARRRVGATPAIGGRAAPPWCSAERPTPGRAAEPVGASPPTRQQGPPTTHRVACERAAHVRKKCERRRLAKYVPKRAPGYRGAP